MKTVIAVRHAKSSWKELGLQDIDRPLNKRGEHDAPKMALKLKNIIEGIDIFYSSPALRAYSTCKYFAEIYNYPISRIYKESDLYFGDDEDMMGLIQTQENTTNAIIYFSHNPTISYFVNRFSDYLIDNIPTCGVSVLQSEVNTWNKINTGNLKLVNYIYPKLVL